MCDKLEFDKVKIMSKKKERIFLIVGVLGAMLGGLWCCSI